MNNLVVAITGASGAILGVKAIEALAEFPDIRCHLVVSQAGAITLKHETGLSVQDLADRVYESYNIRDISCCLASGSFQVDGMLIAPCTIKTMAAISIGLNDNLITRAADVCIKERRRLVMLVRETPLSSIHLTQLKICSDAGAVIMPPVPSFYNGLTTIEEMAQQTALRSLTFFGIRSSRLKVWTGLSPAAEQ